jgi:hypothetical protein
MGATWEAAMNRSVTAAILIFGAACGGHGATTDASSGNRDGAGSGSGTADGGGSGSGDPDGAAAVAMFDTHCLSTPDPDVAAGPDLVGTAIQWHAYFHKKSGELDHTYTWGAFKGSLVSDSHIVYDPIRQRWFITTIVDLGNDRFGVQVMASSDAGATQWKASVPIEMPRLIDDPQPTVTSDKVVITESGPCVWALDKDALLAGNAPVVASSRCDLQQDNQVAAVKYGAPMPAAAYAITMSDPTHLNWISVDGTPAAHDVAVKEHLVQVARVDEVPTFGGVKQYGQDLESGQVKAMWQRGHLVWTKTVTCSTGTCVRLFDVDTAAGTVASHDFALAGTQLFFGGPGLDKYGNAWVLMAAARPDGAVGLALAGVRASGKVEAPKLIVTGQSQLDGDRFGDYFSASMDPIDGSLWLIGQYASVKDAGKNSENTAGCKVVHVTVP